MIVFRFNTFVVKRALTIDLPVATAEAPTTPAARQGVRLHFHRVSPASDRSSQKAGKKVGKKAGKKAGVKFPASKRAIADYIIGSILQPAAAFAVDRAESLAVAREQQRRYTFTCSFALA